MQIDRETMGMVEGLRILEDSDKVCKHQKREDLGCLSQAMELMKAEEAYMSTEIKDNQINL